MPSGSASVPAPSRVAPSATKRSTSARRFPLVASSNRWRSGPSRGGSGGPLQVILVPPRGDWIDDFADFRRDNYHQTVMGRLDPESHHRTTSGYYGLISHIDLQINRLIEGLGDHELLDDTVIIFVSDHGDMMGDHDMYRKSVGYEGSAHVPMIIRPAPRGVRKPVGE